mmetsp:Transcript_81746/g.229286  ORF Transcript_81746/g.229286 Transcript_81746/m.229286 type:complete len:220 (-) Transcript_81746:443-1102(-)
MNSAAFHASNDSPDLTLFAECACDGSGETSLHPVAKRCSAKSTLTQRPSDGKGGGEEAVVIVTAGAGCVALERHVDAGRPSCRDNKPCNSLTITRRSATEPLTSGLLVARCGVAPPPKEASMLRSISLQSRHSSAHSSRRERTHSVRQSCDRLRRRSMAFICNFNSSATVFPVTWGHDSCSCWAYTGQPPASSSFFGCGSGTVTGGCSSNAAGRWGDSS